MAGEIEVSGPDLGTEGLPIEALDGDVPVKAQVGGEPVIVVQTPEGVCVVGGKCTHYGAPLGDGICVDGEIRCPWHHAAFDVTTGEPVGGPALNPIPVYETSVVDGKVVVTGRREATRPNLSKTGPESIVIVGSGAAGAAAAEALRRHGFSGPITLIGEEPPIDRPNVSKDYLAGTAPEEWMPLRSPGFYADAGIELITRRTVKSIDPRARLVEMADGTTLKYDALLLAPGAEPEELEVPGADFAHVRYLRTLEDSKAIISALRSDPKVVVIGAGFIGLEVAASLRQREIDVTVVGIEEVPLMEVMGETMGRFIADLHREHGVVFEWGRNVEKITEDTVILDDGTELLADLVVVGIGVLPRTELAEAAGLTVDDGVVVDDRLRTSDAGIWAAGDIANYPRPDGSRARVEHWVHAQRQGQAAARNILGHDLPYIQPPFFWSQHYDVPINVTGFLDGWEEDVVVGDPGERDVLVAYRGKGLIRAVATIYRDRESLRAEHALAIGDQSALVKLLDE